MNTVENFLKMDAYFKKETKGCLERLSEPQNYNYAKDSCFGVVEEALIMCNVRDIAKLEVIRHFIKLENLKEIVKEAENKLLYEPYEYYSIDNNLNAKDRIHSKMNYIHKEWEKIKIVETLKILRLSKQLSEDCEQGDLFK